MIRLRGLSIVVLAVLLLASVLPMTAASADTVYLKVIRYDGVDNILYDPCYASYGIEVEGADEDDEITYRWQVNVAGIVGNHEWLEASDCTWTWNYFSPVITVRINEDYHTATPPNRFCLRCIVKVEGKEYLSPVFEIIARERHLFDNIAVNGVTLPEAGKKPVSSGLFETDHLSSGPVTWYTVGTDGAYTKMGSGETFAPGKTYAFEIRGTMEESWFLDYDATTATVADTPARVQLEPGDSRSIRVYAVYHLDGTECVPVGYSSDLSNLLHFQRSGIVPSPDEDDEQETNVQLTEGNSFTLSFPYIPIESWAALEGYSILPVWSLKENGTIIKTGSGSSVTYAGWAAGKDYLLTATLGLAKDGKLLPNVIEEFRFIITVAATDQPPVITHQSPKLVDYIDGQDVALYCIASGKSLTYTWYRYGQKKSRFNDTYYTWSPIYAPDKERVTIYEAGAADSGTMYKCVVKNAAGAVESRVFTLNQMSGQIGHLTLTTNQVVENGKACAVSVYGAETGIQAVSGELFVSDDPAATKAASDYPSFIGTVTKKYAGDAIPEGKDCYLGISVMTKEGHSFASDLSATVNLHETKILSLDATTAYILLKVDASMMLPLGDVNGDGEVDVMDYMLVKRHVLQTIVLDADRQSRADVTGDGEIDIKDYTIVKRIVLGTYKPNP
ncbi:MAG: immunoglobulin domain-containing protein [Clostridia bacterium]|nr:immunoglobulin domain-containing protein [Clostridia bacterium]